MSDKWDKIIPRWSQYPDRETIIENIKEHQQISMLISDVLIVALLLGITTNVLADSIFTVITQQPSQIVVGLMVVSAILTLILFFLFKNKINTYRPINPKFRIYFNLDTLLMDSIKEEMCQNNFYKKDFEAWYPRFEQEIINVFTNTEFISKYEFEIKKADQFMDIRKISLISKKPPKIGVEIRTSPLEYSEKDGEKIYYGNISFQINFLIMEPSSPESMNFVDNIYYGTSIFMSKIENIITHTLNNILSSK